MKRYLAAILAFTIIACMTAGCALAEYALTEIPGNLDTMVLADDSLYVQVTTDYPQSVVYKFDSAEGLVLENDTFQSETEILYVHSGQFYAWTESSAVLIGKGNDEKIELHPSSFTSGKKDIYPFLMSMTEGDIIISLMSHGNSSSDRFSVCRTDVGSGTFKSVECAENLYMIQPYHEGESLLIMTNGAVSKDVYTLNWDTLLQTRTGSLPSNAQSIAYSKADDAIYYLADGSLWRFQIGEDPQAVMQDLPTSTDQRGFVLDSGLFVTIYYGAEEDFIMTIDLTSASGE